MEMTIDNLCNYCTNIGCEFQSGIVRTECAFYMPPHVEAIPKEMRAEMEHVEPHDMGEIIILNACKQVVDTRINSLKEGDEDESNVHIL